MHSFFWEEHMAKEWGNFTFSFTQFSIIIIFILNVYTFTIVLKTMQEKVEHKSNKWRAYDTIEYNIIPEYKW